VAGEDSAPFESALVPGGGSFPGIDIRISISGAVCFDTVINIRAAPIVRSIKQRQSHHTN